MKTKVVQPPGKEKTSVFWKYLLKTYILESSKQWEPKITTEKGKIKQATIKEKGQVNY